VPKTLYEIALSPLKTKCNFKKKKEVFSLTLKGRIGLKLEKKPRKIYHNRKNDE